MDLLNTTLDHDRQGQAAHKRYRQISRDSAHDFIVKFSSGVCVAIVASLTRKVAVQSFAYHTHGRNPAVIHGHDKTLRRQCMLAQALPLMINHLTTYPA